MIIDPNAMKQKIPVFYSIWPDDFTWNPKIGYVFSKRFLYIVKRNKAKIGKP